MLKLLLGSHGHLASGMQTAIEILSGKQHNLTIIDAYFVIYRYKPMDHEIHYCGSIEA